MASFVIHNILGEQLLRLLEEDYDIKFNLQQRNEFLLGNLIVDSSRIKFLVEDGADIEESKNHYRNSIQEEKLFTHFRDNDSDLCIQVPNLEKFENKYGYLLNNNLSVIGYLFHLYSDKMFFLKLFSSTFDTLDENMIPTIYNNKTKQMITKD